MSEEKRTYEFSYLVTPTTSEAEIGSVVDSFKADLAKVEAEIISEQAPEFIDLAYVIEKNVSSKKQKWSQGYFGWIKFNAHPETMEVLKKTFDGNNLIMRYMLIKTNPENIIIFKKPKNEARRPDAVTDESIFEGLEEDDSIEALEVHEKLPNLESEM